MNRAYKYLKLTMNQNMKLEFRKKDMKRESEFKKQLYFSFSLSQFQFSSVQLLSRVQLFATPWTAACQASLSITQLLKSHVHCVGDIIQPSHPLLSASPPALNLSQHQGLFQWFSSPHQVAKVLVSASTSVPPMNTRDWSPLGWTGWISLQSKWLSRVFSNLTVQKHQFFGAQLSL